MNQLNLQPFIDSVNDLHEQDLVDGELLIARGNEVLLHKCSQDIASIEEPQFMIACVSKQFFAVALLKALYDSSLEETEEGRVSEVKAKLNAPISQFLPENAAIWSGKMPSWAHTVSLHHLLSRTSGIQSFVKFEEFYARISPEKLFFECAHTPAELMQIMANKPVLFAPGEKFYYRSCSYLVIAEIIEAITGKTVSSYLQEALFGPIGLTSTSNLSKGRSVELRLEHNYRRLVGEWRYDPTGDQKTIYPPTSYGDLSVMKGNGSIISSALDLLKWNQALHKSRLVLPDALYNLFISENLACYGYGIFIDEGPLGKILCHVGSRGGGSQMGTHGSFLCYVPDHDLSIVLLSHIEGEYEKLDGEYWALYSELQKTISAEEECDKKAEKIIFEKYQGKRGFDKIFDQINVLLH